MLEWVSVKARKQERCQKKLCVWGKCLGRSSTTYHIYGTLEERIIRTGKVKMGIGG